MDVSLNPVSRKYIVSKNVANILELLGVTLIVLVFLVPIVWILLTSFKTGVDTYSLKVFFKPTLENYVRIFSPPYNFQNYLVNSLIVAVVTLGISIPLSIAAAYSLSRFNFFGKQGLLFLILSTQFIPLVVMVLPFYIIFRNMGILDTCLALIIINTGRTIPFAIWLIKGFVDGIPKDIEEAALVDGCSRFQILWKIIFPLAKPGILTALVFCFVTVWNEFMFALILTRESAVTLPIALMLFVGERGVLWEQMAAGGIVLVLPTIIVMLLARKHFVQGLTVGAID